MSEELDAEQLAKLREMIDTWDSTRGAIKALKILGVIVKWTVGLGASFAIIWGAIHGGSPK